MPVGNAPQFRGIDAVLEAYENAGIPAYAVCYAKDINLRYMGDSVEEGAELLKAWMQKVKEFGSQAIYQLRMYEELAGKPIRSNSAYDMAFKFVLNERDQNYLPAAAADKVSNSDLIKILGDLADLKAENAVLKIKLDQYEEEDEEEQKQRLLQQGKPAEKEKSIGEVMLEKFTPQLCTLGERFVDALIPPVQVSKVSGIVIETGNVDEEKLIAQSIRRLRNAIPDDPGVGVVLMRLADISEKDRPTFNFYLSFILKGT